MLARPRMLAVASWLAWFAVACRPVTPPTTHRPEPAPPTHVPVTPPPATPAVSTDTAPSEVAGSVPAPPPPLTYPFHEAVPPPSELAKGKATELANLSPADCKRRLAKSGVTSRRHHGFAKGVATPVTVEGAIAGVSLRVPPRSSHFGVLDCRLALALEPFLTVLAAHDVTRVRIDGFYRPHAHLPGKKRTPSQHAHGLAMDLVSFELKDGTELVVENDWHGAMGAAACGPAAFLEGETTASIRLRNLLCDVARRGIFHTILTPNHDAAHKNHFHLDIKRNGRWYSVD